MNSPTFDYVIIGQGLAGTLLAWHLRRRGRRVVLLDRDEPVTASKIAAGLINPITGQRANLSWRLTEFLPIAERFYRSVEKELGAKFFHRARMARLLPDEKAVEKWRAIAGDPDVLACLSEPQPAPLVDHARVRAGAGGFEVVSSHILDVPEFLTASRQILDVRMADIDVVDAIVPSADGVAVKVGSETLVAGRLIFCQGPDARRGNPYFDWVPFCCAKGEILTVNCPELKDERRVLIGPGWLAPVPAGAPGCFRAGSTYTHDDLNAVPTDAGRNTIETKLRALLKVNFEVTGHAAAIRPVIDRSRALIGCHPKHQRIGFFNGLGSKGSLNGPAIAGQFAAHLEEAAPLEHDFDLLKNL